MRYCETSNMAVMAAVRKLQLTIFIFSTFLYSTNCMLEQGEFNFELKFKHGEPDVRINFMECDFH